MFIEKKVINGKEYYYLKHSFREGKIVKTKTLAYIGNKKDSDKIRILKKKFNGQMLVNIKKELFEIKDWNVLLSSKDREKIEEIVKQFSLKLKKLDESTKKDMFDDFLTSFVYNTNAIEGNTLTLKETDLLLNKDLTPQGRTLREINDHLNSRDVFYYLYNNNLPITNETIILIHDKLMNNIDERKGYRLSEVIGATFKSTPFQYINTDMNLLIKWYNKNKQALHPVIIASIFHHKFERIHPFYDGNGRTGRMLLNLMLFRSNIVPIVLSNKQRKKYYEALSTADKTGLLEITEDFKTLVKFISTQILKTWNTIFKQWG
ncbi:Fic family protein [Candidatus Woesearchaeota archaeon]|nr:Fic family protein [Candidatus Woesearchaeota archaeon]